MRMFKMADCAQHRMKDHKTSIYSINIACCGNGLLTCYGLLIMFKLNCYIQEVDLSGCVLLPCMAGVHSEWSALQYLSPQNCNFLLIGLHEYLMRVLHINNTACVFWKAKTYFMQNIYCFHWHSVWKLLHFQKLHLA